MLTEIWNGAVRGKGLSQGDVAVQRRRRRNEGWTSEHHPPDCREEADVWCPCHTVENATPTGSLSVEEPAMCPVDGTPTDVLRAKNAIRKFASLLVVASLVDDGLWSSAVGWTAESNWYTRSFFLLHLDYHTKDTMEVGRESDPVITARLLGLVQPDVIQIHAKGAPGWTTYPTQIGHSPPKLARDVLQVWSEIARSAGYAFSIYYNIGRDGEIMRRHPTWNRVHADGKPYPNMLCYHSGVADEYLWPMIDELMARYRPGGFWFDGSCFTVMNCYCPACRDRFRREHGFEAPRTPQAPGWAAFKEMQRQIYREFCARTAARIKQRDPSCLVAFNWAYSLRMPEEPPPGVDYFTGDHGSRVDDLAPDAIWYDSQGRPFDLMTCVFYVDRQGPHLKPRVQLEQEMAIILAHGGRYFAWDSPSREGGLIAPHYEMMARVITPFLRARQTWCLGSHRLPDVSLFHGAAFALHPERPEPRGVSTPEPSTARRLRRPSPFAPNSGNDFRPPPRTG